MSKKSRQHAPRVPLNVAGGIRSQAGRRRHAHHWWGERWVTLIEQFMPGPRLGRGRSYAASGQVTALELAAGCVTASVQGASPEPYRVEIRLPLLPAAARRQVLAALQSQPILMARLLVRDLPPELETVFHDAGFPLFPQRREELLTQCSCPDWANPCKHAAAVSFLLAEAIDREPLLLLALRGIAREDLLGAGLKHAAATAPPRQPKVPGRRPRATAPAPVADRAAALPADPAAFWGAAPAAATAAAVEPDFGTAPPCDDAAPLVRRLGPLPFWRGEERFLDAMRTAYTRAASRGWTVWSGERLDLPRSGGDDGAAPAGGFRIRRRHLNMDLTIR